MMAMRPRAPDTADEPMMEFTGFGVAGKTHGKGRGRCCFARA